MALRSGERTTRLTVRRGFGPLAAVVLMVLGAVLAGAIPSLNPFGTETVDRSQPAVLKSIEKLNDYRAATANLQVIVDVEQDARLIPSFIKGEKVLLVAAGNVDAGVSFDGLKGRAVTVDGKAVSIALPAPTLSKPRLNLERSRVYNRDRGILRPHRVGVRGQPDRRP